MEASMASSESAESVSQSWLMTGRHGRVAAGDSNIAGE